MNILMECKTYTHSSYWSFYVITKQQIFSPLEKFYEIFIPVAVKIYLVSGAMFFSDVILIV